MTSPTATISLDRAAGALYGLAIGDALGMPTQMLSRQRIQQLWGRIERFEPAPEENPISRGMSAGQVTDDTDQAVIVGRLLVSGAGTLDPHRLAEELIAWHARMEAKGSLDLLGPSTMRALNAVKAGASVTESGRWGDTNGAAMRIAPVGVACAIDPLPRFVDAVERVDVLTHNTIVAHAGAAAVAAVVSAGVSGASLADALEVGVAAAREGATRGHFIPGPDVAARIEWACQVVKNADQETAADAIDQLVGTSVATQEAVPAAFALAASFGNDPWQAVCLAASLGGDSDTVAAITGAMVGACNGKSGWPDEAVEQVRDANPNLQLDQLASDLLALRGVG